MAKLIINDVEYDIIDGSKIRAACERAGVVFNCNTGVCGECEIEVLTGMENLNPITEEELQAGMQSGRRLACKIGRAHV
jgi:ferredoxin